MVGSGPAPSPTAEPYRVMIVDDSAVVRGLIARMLEADPTVTVVASVGNGQMAVSALDRHDVEVVVLDIEMPVMDGLTALPKLLQRDPGLQVIMASTLTLRNADISLRALEAGAADYIPKPSSSRDLSASEFKRELVAKVKALGVARRRQAPRPGTRPRLPLRHAAAAGAIGAPPLRPGAAPPRGVVVLRPASTEIPEVIAIGSSTGGPQALFALLAGIPPGTLRQPILITQHMPATFTTILAEHIARISGWPAAEAQDGEPLRGGRIYVAPGDFHLTVESKGGGRVLRLLKTPPENYCRPSVDPMLRSLAEHFGRRVLAVILTGMGTDGRNGGQAVVAAGGSVIAQDEASSVVWGMPGAVAHAGLCSAVLPLSEIAAQMSKMAGRRG